MSQILVVDDEVGIRELLSEILRDEGHQVRLAQNAGEARQIRVRVRPDLVLLDIWMPDTDGITLLKEWASTGLLTMPVVMMSGHGTIDTAVEATRIGAYAFLEKPIALQKLLSTVGTALRQGTLKSNALAVPATVGKSRAVEQLRTQLERLRTLKSSALFVGEPGAGMEQCARLLHQLNTPWVAPEDFSAFDQMETNLVGQASEGILFLREVGEMTRAQQKNLLNQTLKLERYNTRMLSSSSTDLAELVAKGAFEPRLYAILAGVILRLPGLRERAEDVPELANLVLSRAIESKEAPTRSFNTAALNALRNYHWPGNLVQLESVVKTVAQLALGGEIGVADVTNALATLEAPLPSPAQTLPLDRELREARDAFERVYFEYHLSREGGNMSRVAERVGLERTHLYRKLKQLGVKLPRRAEE
ncbi:MAG: sigma-54-dependent Fis family transcriptional regulator [Betaproteobacteria bacterium]|nr:sigma-54-dependent Fis family transcriptional regulator [Betaproteobacteria bacterium]